MLSLHMSWYTEMLAAIVDFPVYAGQLTHILYTFTDTEMLKVFVVFPINAVTTNTHIHVAFVH